MPVSSGSKNQSNFTSNPLAIATAAIPIISISVAITTSSADMIFEAIWVAKISLALCDFKSLRFVDPEVLQSGFGVIF